VGARRHRGRREEGRERLALGWDYVLEVHPYPTNLAAGAKLDRSKTPALGQPEKLTLPPMQRATLSNGLKVVMVERHNAPVVDFSLLVRGGYSADPAGMPGVVSFTQRMLEEGTPRATRCASASSSRRSARPSRPAPTWIGRARA
jgi:hypothetical protein